MKRGYVMALSLTAVAILMSTASGLSAAFPLKDKVVDFVRTYDNAWNRKDVPSVERALAADYVYFTSKGDV